MTEIENQALALVNKVLYERDAPGAHGIQRRTNSYHEAICRALEQKAALQAEFDQHKRDVSDAVEHYLDQWKHSTPSREVFACQFGSFIITKPDPLVEAREEAKKWGVTAAAIHEGPTSEELRLMKDAADFAVERFEEALAARGLKIMEAE